MENNNSSQTIEDLENQDVGDSSKTEQKEEKQENTRSKIANIYVVGYLIIVFIVIIIGALKNYTISDNKDMLLTLSAVLSGPLGFIIGYYFKSDQ